MTIYEARNNLDDAIRAFRRDGGKRKIKGGYTAEAKRALTGLLEAKKAFKTAGGQDVSAFNCALPKQHKVIIDLSDAVKASGFARLKEYNPRKKNTGVAADFDNYFSEDSFQYGGRYKSYYGSTLNCHIKSYGVISKCGGILGFMVDDKKGSLAAPKGYRWELLNGSIALVKNGGDEYHINGEDLLLSPRDIAKKLRVNAERRKAARMATGSVAKDKLKEIKAILVAAGTANLAVSHSFAVGNCKAGTISFLDKVGFTKADSLTVVAANELKAKFDKHKSRLSSMEIERFLLALKRYQVFK